ncbi:MAG: hypothetical protein AB8C84_03220 [Oligoflexales bacterium]
MTKINRRRFTQYLGNSLVASALSRTFTTTQAFGAEGKLKLMICTSPNGHMNSQITKQAFTSVIDPAIIAKHGLFINGMKGANYAGDWHGGEAGFLGFRGGKGSAPSFYTTIPQITKTYLSIGGDNYPRDSVGNAVNTIKNPADALKQNFGLNLTTSQYNLNLIEQGKKGILDPAISDIKKIKSLLGQDSVLFEDYMESLYKLYQEQVPTTSKNNTKNSQSSNSESSSSTAYESKLCEIGTNIANGSTPDANHAAMLEVAFQLFACDLSHVVVVSFLDSTTDPQHQYIHGDGSNDNGAKFQSFTDATQKRVAKVINQMGQDENLLAQSAIVYASEGSAHFLGGSFNNGHPNEEIPCVVFGSLGGAISAKGDLSAGSNDQRNLWKSLANGLAGGNADVSSINGDGVTPLF